MLRVVCFVLCLCLATASVPSPEATTTSFTPSSTSTPTTLPTAGGTSESGYTIQAEGNPPFIEFAVDNVTQVPFLESDLLTLEAKRQQLFERLNTSLGRVEALDLEWMDINHAAHTPSASANTNTDTDTSTSGAAEEYFSLTLNETVHGFMAAAWKAHAFHRPLVLKADHIWQVILEGFARHVDCNAEYLRRRFVDFDGQKELFVRRDDIVLGQEGNNWASVFADFASQIREQTHADVYGVVVGDPFSTSTPLDMLLRNIALMNSQKHYFKYTGIALCGFPSIRLEGVRADYVALRERVERLAPFLTEGFQESWIPALRSVLDEFVKVWDGQIDRHFWSSMIKYNRFPAMYTVEDVISGWINALFPYTSKKTPNRCAVPWSEMRAKMQAFEQLQQEQSQDIFRLSDSVFGMAPAEFAPFEHKVPVKWLSPLSNREFELTLLGSFSSPLVHSASGAVRPSSAWSLVRVSETTCEHAMCQAVSL